MLEVMDANRRYPQRYGRWRGVVDSSVGRDQNNSTEQQLSARVTGWEFWGREENGNSKLRLAGETS